MPLIALVTIHCGRFILGVLLVLLAGWVALALRSSGSSGCALQAFGDFLAAALFTVAFSHLVVRERRVSHQLGTARERNRIAREIHHGLGHYFTSANVQLEAARAMVADRAAGQHLRCAQALLHQGVNELRHTVSMLRADGDQRALSRAMSSLLDEACADGLTSELHVSGDVRPLDAAIELALYRAAQDALANVRRQPRARRADVKIHYGESAVELTIRDSAGGLQTGAGHAFGLAGLPERFAMLKGVVMIGVAPDGGMDLRVLVPG